jgi:hypothetical protein
MMPPVLGLVSLLLVAAAGAAVPTVGISVAAVDGPGEILRAVSIPERDQVLAVDTIGWADGNQRTWTLDLRRREWQLVSGPPRVTAPSLLAHIPGQDTVLAIPQSPGAVWDLDLDVGSWQERAVPRTRPVGVTDVAVDTRRREVLAWSDADDELWSYDPAANRWVEIPYRAPWPSAGFLGTDSGYTLVAYDTAVDRLVLAVLPLPGRAGSTWLFDPGKGRWTRQASKPPPLMMGYGEWGTESTYDPVHRRTVAFARGTIATYDARRDRWEVPSNSGWPGLTFGPDPGLAIVNGEDPWPEGVPVGPLSRADHQLVADPARGRVLVLGGSALFRVIGATGVWDVAWRPVTDLWAYDLGANSWTLLVGGQR